MMRRGAAAAIAATLVLVGGCVGEGPPIALAPFVDMQRIYGGWFMVATIPNAFERGVVEPYDVYSKAADGGIKEDFFGRWGSFDAKRRHLTARDWVRPGTNNAHWRAQPIWPLNLPFLVLYVDPDYRYVMFGERGRDLGWIFSRSQQIPDADYQALLSRFAALGYDKNRFRRVVQSPSRSADRDFGATASRPRGGRRLNGSGGRDWRGPARRCGDRAWRDRSRLGLAALRAADHGR